jgi:hypothetical protein
LRELDATFTEQFFNLSLVWAYAFGDGGGAKAILVFQELDATTSELCCT